ncbi:MAG: hypothetical protein AAGG11_11910 [Pseudomonadota bacterium]
MQVELRNMRSLILLALLGLLAGPGQGAETVLFNESPAYMCYLAAIDKHDRDDGIEDCDTAIELQGLTTEAMAATLSNRGLLLARSGEVEAAIKDHDRAVRLAPDNGSLFINRANAYTLQSKFLPALQDLDYAVELSDAQVHLAYYNRALIHSRLGNRAAARADAERAVAAAPESDRYASFLQSLEQELGGSQEVGDPDTESTETDAPDAGTPDAAMPDAGAPDAAASGAGRRAGANSATDSARDAAGTVDQPMPQATGA